MITVESNLKAWGIFSRVILLKAKTLEFNRVQKFWKDNRTNKKKHKRRSRKKKSNGKKAKQTSSHKARKPI